MKYLQGIRDHHQDPEGLEELYQSARGEGESDQFAAAVLACRREEPDNLLFAAWYFRLQQFAPEAAAARRPVNWLLAVLIGGLTGLLFWLLSDPSLELPRQVPAIFLFWALVGAGMVILFLTLAARKGWRAALLVLVGLLAAGAYVALMVTLWERRYYQDLMALHLPALAWAGVGVALLKGRSEPRERFAFLLKSLEVFVTGGLFLMAGVAFGGITVGLFEALDISLSEELLRFLSMGGLGLVLVLAVAFAYDPLSSPAGQRFREGLSKLISTLMQLLLPLTLLVLVVYLVAIPFNFMAPFRNRDLLIIYNVMLFAIMGLILGVTPVRSEDLTPRQRRDLRRGILAVALLAVVVSLYALSAVVYRTIQGGITVNRLTVIGWNSINIGVLIMLVIRQIKDGAENWVASMHRTISSAASAYIVWTLFIVIAIPLIFWP